MELWLPFTLLAVVMQSLRTAGQKQLASHLSVPGTTLVRFLYGLPFAALYYLCLLDFYDMQILPVSKPFLFWCSLAAVSQIAATFFLVKALQWKNFAVGTALAKTESLLAALVGSWFFAETLSSLEYVSVALGVGGALLASNWRLTGWRFKENSSIGYGLGAGLGFALASVWLREGILSLGVPPQPGAAFALFYMVSVQTLVCLVWVFINERHQLKAMVQQSHACVFIGFTSVAGSVGWFTAVSLQNAALVRTVGQSEFLVTLALTYFYFGETITRREYLGMLFILMSVLMLLLLP